MARTRSSGGRIAARVRAACVAVLFVACACVLGVARADGEREYLAERAAVVGRLREVAAWCQSKKLAPERRRALQAILGLEPDDEAARKALLHTRMQDGTWHVPKAPRLAPSTGPDAEEAARRFEEALLPFRTAVAAATAASVPPVIAERAAADLAAVLPDDPDARRWNGEVRVGDAWLLAESARAIEHGKALRAGARAAYEKAPEPDSGQATDDEAKLGGPFPEVRSNDDVRILGAAGTAEAAACARAVAAVNRTFEPAFGRAPVATRGMRMLLFPDRARGLAAAEKDPRFDAERLRWVRTLESTWAKGSTDIYVWSDDAPRRIEWSVRQALQAQVLPQLGLTPKRGALFEGTGHWFSGAILGTHCCFFVRQSEYADGAKAQDDLARKLKENGADWDALARDLAAGKDWPDLRVTLGHDVNALTAPEMLQGYVLARFLIEGRADGGEVVLEARLDRGADAWCGAKLRSTVEGLSRKLRRFVRETR